MLLQSRVHFETHEGQRVRGRGGQIVRVVIDRPSALRRTFDQERPSIHSNWRRMGERCLEGMEGQVKERIDHRFELFSGREGEERRMFNERTASGIAHRCGEQSIFQHT